MKQKIFAIIFCLCCTHIFTQVSADIFDLFYEDVKIWENIGLINDAPIVRPYPLQEVKRILNIVLENGTENQIRRAKEYQNRFFGKFFHFGGSSELGLKFPKRRTDFSFAPIAELNFSLKEIITGSAHINFSLLNKLPKNESLPAFNFSKKDIVEDNSSIGKFTLLPMFNSTAALGTPQYYFQAGMARTSFGPFFQNNILVGEQALHSGQFIFVINKEKFSYNQILLVISGTNDKGDDLSPQKFLASHSITYNPLPWVSIGLLDMIVYGKRFEPLYLIPLSAFFIGQSIFNFPDNSLLGLTFTIKPVRGLKIDGVLLADDLGFNRIIRFKPARWRMAGQFGISYALPKDHWLTFVDFNYTLVTPYCYTHVGSHEIDDTNFENYTHNGVSLGSNLQPNSDRINLKLKFRPVYGLDLDFYNTFIRHANISESINNIEILKDYISKKYNTDGSVLNHATITIPDKQGTYNKEHAFLYSTPFLKQQTIQYINQLGLDFLCHLPILKSGGKIIFKAGYIFEANINPGVSNGIYSPNASFKDWNSKTLEELAAREGTTVQDIKNRIHNEAARQLELWRSQAVGRQFNHYIRISIRVAY